MDYNALGADYEGQEKKGNTPRGAAALPKKGEKRGAKQHPYR
jgi:ubiquitin